MHKERGETVTEKQIKGFIAAILADMKKEPAATGSERKGTHEEQNDAFHSHEFYHSTREIH